MMALLVLLTSMNYFIYNGGDNSNTVVSLADTGTTEDSGYPEESQNNPAGPDEKGPGNPVSISEEFLHEQEESASLFIDNLIHQLLLACSKVHPVHFELITPPPDFRA